jgi:hypothetical protein
MILSLCFVHIMPDAFSSMEGLSNYPVAGLLILAGLLLILISERVGVELLMQKQSSALESTVVVCCHSQAHHGRISHHSSVAHIHRRHAYTFHGETISYPVQGTHVCGTRTYQSMTSTTSATQGHKTALARRAATPRTSCRTFRRATLPLNRWQAFQGT